MDWDWSTWMLVLGGILLLALLFVGVTIPLIVVLVLRRKRAED